MATHDTFDSQNVFFNDPDKGDQKSNIKSGVEGGREHLGDQSDTPDSDRHLANIHQGEHFDYTLGGGLIAGGLSALPEAIESHNAAITGNPTFEFTPVSAEEGIATPTAAEAPTPSAGTVSIEAVPIVLVTPSAAQISDLSGTITQADFAVVDIADILPDAGAADAAEALETDIADSDEVIEDPQASESPEDISEVLAPTVIAGNIAGQEGVAQALNIEITSNSINVPDEEMTVLISDIPDGATLSAGIDNGDGTWTVNANQLEGLTITAPPGIENYSLTVSATSTAGSESATSAEVDFSFDVSAGGENIIGTPGRDTLVGTDYSDTIDGLGNNDNISAGSGDDTVQGGAGNDDIYGEEGNDTLYGGSGRDDIEGGTGEDILYGDSGNDRLYGQEGNDELHGGDSNDQLYGGEGTDTLYGDAGSDQLYGNEGEDILYGGEGGDRLYGGDASDTLYGEGGNDRLYGGEGSDTAHGGSGNDQLYGEAGDDTLHGDAGNDTLRGDAGSDIIYGGEGRDNIRGGDDSDALYGDAGDDRIYGDSGNDTLYGGEGNDRMYGGNDDDTLYGEGGNDTLRGDSGSDTIYGGEGVDNIRGGNDNDTLYGDAGDDRVYGDNGNDTLYGGEGNDRIYGGNNDDVLYGGEGNDRLQGDRGDDTIEGGAGNDQAFGNAGNDTFIFGSGDGQDSFRGGNGSWTDSIRLEDVNGGPSETADTPGSWVLETNRSYTIDTENNTIEFDGSNASGTITLADGSELSFTQVEKIEW